MARARDGDVRDRADRGEHRRGLVGDRRAHGVDLEVRLHAPDEAAQIAGEAAHQARDNDDHGDAERDARHREVHDAVGAQVAHREKKGVHDQSCRIATTGSYFEAWEAG